MSVAGHARGGRLCSGGLLAVLLLALSCGRHGDEEGATKQRPDLILIVVECLRADHLGAYGYKRATSPALASLAARGALFDEHSAQSSATLPSMVSLMLGRAILADAQRVPAGVPTLAERLAASGYQTVAFAGNPLVSRAAGFDRGFEVFLTRDDTGHETWDARDLHALVTGWLAKNPRDGRPRFLYVHFMDPHFPYAPDDRKAVPGESPDVPVEQRVRVRDDVFGAWSAVLGAAGAGNLLYDSFNNEHWVVKEQIDAYDRELANVDAAIGAILDSLGSGGRLVIVAADHGEALWERALTPQQLESVPADRMTLTRVFEHGHGGTLSQELLATPLIISGAGFPVARRVGSATSNLDIVPTLLRAAGIEADDALEGVALQELASGRPIERPPIFSASRLAVAVRDPVQGYRLVVPTPEGEALGVPLQLYNLSADPHERNNLALATLAEATPEATAQLQSLREAHDAALAEFKLFEGQSLLCEDPEQAKVIAEFEEGRE
jgi:arylsulfatase